MILLSKIAKRTGKRIQINGVWQRTDYGIVILCTGQIDISPMQMLKKASCIFCMCDLPHTECLHNNMRDYDHQTERNHHENQSHSTI